MIRRNVHSLVAGAVTAAALVFGPVTATEAAPINFSWSDGPTSGTLAIDYVGMSGSNYTYSFVLANTSSDASVLTGFRLDVDPDNVGYVSDTSTTFSYLGAYNASGQSFDFCFQNDANNNCDGNDPNAQLQPGNSESFQIVFSSTDFLTFLSAGGRFQRTTTGGGSLKLIDECGPTEDCSPPREDVPEPGTLALLGLGLLGLGVSRRRNQLLK